MRKTIITVDDDPCITKSIKDLLNQLHPEWKVIEANSGMACLKFLDSVKIDLFLLDILMPQMDGWELALKIKERQESRNVPIIFLSSLMDSLSIKTGSLIGQSYVEKPFDPYGLNKIIESLL